MWLGDNLHHSSHGHIYRCLGIWRNVHLEFAWHYVGRKHQYASDCSTTSETIVRPCSRSCISASWLSAHFVSIFFVDPSDAAAGQYFRPYRMIRITSSIWPSSIGRLSIVEDPPGCYGYQNNENIPRNQIKVHVRMLDPRIIGIEKSRSNADDNNHGPDD